MGLASPSSYAASAGDSEIGEAYALPTFKELTQTTILLGGLDINDPKIADEYAKLSYCDLYKNNYKNDFQWNNIKQQIVSRVLEKKEMYRLQYEIHGSVRLGRYDFERQFFPFVENSKLVNVGSMVILESSSYTKYCDGLEIGLFPKTMFVILNQPLTLDSIKMPMDEAEKFLAKLEDMKIFNRTLYVRFRFKIIDVSRVVASREKEDKNVRTDFRGKLSTIDFYYDREMTKWAASAPVI